MIKRIAFLFLQLLVTAAGIYYVFHDPHVRAEIVAALRHSDWRWLLGGWACYSLVESLATVRWQMLLRVQGIGLSWLHAGAIVVIGLFFNMFLPGLIGGDAMRLYLVFKEKPARKTRATLSVAMDRLLGLISILLLALLVVIWRFDWLKQVPQTLHITYLALALLGGSALFMGVIVWAVGFGLLRRLPEKLPLREAIVESGDALRVYARHPGVCLAALCLTILSHLAYYLSYYCAAHSLHAAAGREASLLDFVSIMPLVNTITGVPISFGGVGVREALFKKLLGHLAGVPVATAALAASLGYAIQASWGLIGGASYLLVPFGKSPRPTKR
jgi:glycosyltransferase 2 family protein